LSNGSSSSAREPPAHPRDEQCADVERRFHGDPGEALAGALLLDSEICLETLGGN
jgi:hypothetical protein